MEKVSGRDLYRRKTERLEKPTICKKSRWRSKSEARDVFNQMIFLGENLKVEKNNSRKYVINSDINVEQSSKIPSEKRKAIFDIK